MPTSDRTIRVGTIDVTVRTSNRTTLTVTVTQSGNIIVRGPHSTTDTDAATLVERRRSWIYRQLSRLTETTPDNPRRELIRGAGFDALGRPHRLHIAPDDDQDEPLIQYRSTPTDGWLHIRRSTTLKPDEAIRTIIKFYAETGHEWLKLNYPQIARYTLNSSMPVTVTCGFGRSWECQPRFTLPPGPRHLRRCASSMRTRWGYIVPAYGKLWDRPVAHGHARCLRFHHEGRGKGATARLWRDRAVFPG
ncbi:YgjP-like metallopeptidase domain-containing protein [Streptomyces sp. NPDC001492]